MTMNTLLLFALSVHERKLLEHLLQSRLAEDFPRTTEEPGTEAELLMNLLDYIRSGGFETFCGSVVDQDAESGWEVTATAEGVRQWADDMSVVCFETPRVYKIAIERHGFGAETQISYTPDSSKSKLIL